MDEGAVLDALGNLLTELADSPYDISLHAQHIRLAQSAAELESEAVSAREMMTNYLAAGDDVWIPLLDAKEKGLSRNNPAEVEEFLALYARAENDYLSIPILTKHADFILQCYAEFHGEGSSVPEGFGDVFSTEWTRLALQDVVDKGLIHLTGSPALWEKLREWEEETLSLTSPNERQLIVQHVDELYLTRLEQPNSDLDAVMQQYSTFTTNCQPPQEYETLLVSASKLRGRAAKSYQRRERFEASLIQQNLSLEVHAQYIASECRARNPDLFVITGVFERAIAEAAKRTFHGESAAELILWQFWIDYCDAIRINNADTAKQLQVVRRAVRSVPGCGEIWARYIRLLEHLSTSEEQQSPADETVAEVFIRALETKLLQKDVEQIVSVFLARAGYEKRQIERGDANEEQFGSLLETLEQGIALVRNALPTGDPRLRLEKYLTEIYLHFASAPESALEVWKQSSKAYKTSYLAWTSYTDALIKQDQYAEARTIFKDLCMKNLDWPEAIWESWISFEHLYGTVEDLEACLDKVHRARQQVQARRAKEAEKASYKAMQMAVEEQASVLITEAITERDNGAAPESMDVDSIVHAQDSGAKRKAEDSPQPDGNKKARVEAKPPPLKRDRENCTVFVADLPAGVTEEDLRSLFKDCGSVREIKITQLPNALVATVEFSDRDSVPAALTKDKKRIQEQEISVHLAWKSTLYVTNFAEKADDAFIRELFGKYGVIFDVRWPSKKFKNSRRFCYVQFTSPTSAEKALEQHGKELEPGLALNVYISNPERKKERTDADANEREVYVAGLSKFTSKEDLEKLFRTYGNLKEVRMATDKDGSCRGFAFVEFEEAKDAQNALNANNYELKKRRIAVTIADSRVRARNKATSTDTGFGRKSDVKSRSVRIRNLPPATQEGLLHQLLEKYVRVKRVEVFADRGEAVAELESLSEAGKLVLHGEAIVFNGKMLDFSEELTQDSGAPTRPPGPALKTGGLFVPRAAASRPRAGLGHTKKLGTGASAASSNVPINPSGSSKRQDDFRKMLGGA